ncbi:hypothetical protein HAX54_021995 [Datura stramonium]|uniref:Uncharacterized protein n=1 Tax=Datura stramonium TaxID=4076 RepID=A0ABS8S3Z2_DATST|nr:hypothetical protein [Datura stramonium]
MEGGLEQSIFSVAASMGEVHLDIQREYKGRDIWRVTCKRTNTEMREGEEETIDSTSLSYRGHSTQEWRLIYKPQKKVYKFFQLRKESTMEDRRGSLGNCGTNEEGETEEKRERQTIKGGG